MKIRNPSPLRYPGGKVVLAGVLKSILYANSAQGGLFVEPFAGGAGAALKLLSDGHVNGIYINDKDRAISSFWRCVTENSEAFAARIRTVELSIEEWRRQRAIYRRGTRSGRADLGFAAFYLNRCNRSGIVKNGGPIGGIAQSGRWDISARFSRAALARRVEEIGEFGTRVTSSGLDAGTLLRRLDPDHLRERVFIFADPPYYHKGRELYLNHFIDADHDRFAKEIRKVVRAPWVVTYDDVPEVRNLYGGCQIIPYRLRYSAHKASQAGGEILIAPPHVCVPPEVVKVLDAAFPESCGN